ncbi:N66 matrix protein-like [Helianthus annuus]|uniref:N66 matrix protein-like n=1 Tax=Helianthus annuus TaxID=4232 RepID=UPI000B9007AC|nr:N66 matrix protein-like [Helianthus annuus]
MVITSKPPTITEAIDLSVALTEQAIRWNKFSTSDGKKKETHIESSGENKRKFSNFKKGTQGSSSGTNKKRDANPPIEVRTGVASFESKGKGHVREACWYGVGRRNGGSGGNRSGNCAGNGNGNQTGNRHQGGNDGNANRGGSGNQAGNGNRGATNNQEGNGNGNGNGRGQGCFGSGDIGHFKRDCPKNNQAQGRVFNIGAREARQNPNVVTGTFPINQHFASVLLDSGANYSFVSIEF